MKLKISWQCCRRDVCLPSESMNNAISFCANRIPQALEEFCKIPPLQGQGQTNSAESENQFPSDYTEGKWGNFITASRKKIIFRSIHEAGKKASTERVGADYACTKNEIDRIFTSSAITYALSTSWKTAVLRWHENLCWFASKIIQRRAKIKFSVWIHRRSSLFAADSMRFRHRFWNWITEWIESLRLLTFRHR